MIKLSETTTHEYFAVPVPRDATDIEQSHFHLFYELPNHIIEKSIYVGKEFELLGVIGNEDEISEEVAREIVEGNNGGCDDTLWMDYSAPNHSFAPFACQTAKTSLVSLIASKRILVENPILYPLLKHYPPQEEYIYRRNLIDWQSYESKLVKAVILKIKK